MNYRKKLIWLIAVCTLIRIIIASTEEFGNAEAYYWVLATKLQWNYFDHPPIVAWLIRLTTLNLLIHSELFVRLGAIISSGICTWLMFRIGSMLYDERAGWFAALLYATSIYSGITIAVFILPDSPQMVFWLASLYILFKIVRIRADDPELGNQWLLFGLLTGLCIMCKVHGVFLWFGAAVYFLIFDRDRLKNKYVYFALGLTLLIVSPILIWNLQNDFVTYKFHSSRVSVAGAGADPLLFISQVYEIILALGPIHIVLIVMGIYKAITGKLSTDKNYVRLILSCSLPLILALLVICLFKKVLPYWAGPALSTLFILPAAWLAASTKNIGRAVTGVLKFAIGYALVIALMYNLTINYFPGTLSTEKEGMKTGTDDATLDMYGWKLAGKKFDSVYRSDVAQKLMPANAPLVITTWTPAAHIDYYLANRTGLETYGIGSVYELHQYFWMNDDKRRLLRGESAYYVVPSNAFTYKSFDKVLGSFKNYNFALIFSETRSGVVCKQYYILRLNGYKGNVQ